MDVLKKLNYLRRDLISVLSFGAEEYSVYAILIFVLWQFLALALYIIHELTLFEWIIITNKYDIGIRQLVIIMSGQQQLHIHLAMIIPCSQLCRVVGHLHLDIIRRT